MDYVTWEELDEITNLILDDVFDKTDFVYQSNWIFDGNIKHEYYPGIYEYNFCNVPIEYQWTKWKILEWFQEAWEVLISYEICNYWNEFSRIEVLITYLSLISLYFSYFIDWQVYFFHNYAQYLDILNINANELLEFFTTVAEETTILSSQYNFLDNNKITNFQTLWCLIIDYQKSVLQVLAKCYINRENLYSSVSRSAEIELDEDYIYYSLEDFYKSEYYFQRNEVEKIFERNKIEKILYLEGEKKTVMYKIHPECPFDTEIIEIFDDMNYLYTACDLKYTDMDNVNAIRFSYRDKIEKPFNNLCVEATKRFFEHIQSIVTIEYYNIDEHTYQYGKRNELVFFPKLFNASFIIEFQRNCLACSFGATKELPCYSKDLIDFVYLHLKDTKVSQILNNSFLFYTHMEIEDVFGNSFDNLVSWIVESINFLFPLVLITIYENPLPAIEEHLKIWNPRYSLEEYVDRTRISYNTLNNWIKTLQRKKQIIFQGSPGTGKTFIAENIAQYLIGGTDGFYETIQFHPAYTYEDFIQGIRPQTNNGQLEYNLVSGRFLEFCCKAETCKDNCILIIDEINRANLSQVFGELMYLLEYRDKEIALAGSDDKFKIPGNVYIIGTMNTADRSIAVVDFALRRRFAFIKVEPNYEIIRQFYQESNNIDVEGLISVLERINRAISYRDYFIGISYFLTENLAEDIENIWCLEIETYLEEYFYNAIDRVNEFRWENVKEEIINI